MRCAVQNTCLLLPYSYRTKTKAICRLAIFDSFHPISLNRDLFFSWKRWCRRGELFVRPHVKTGLAPRRRCVSRRRISGGGFNMDGVVTVDNIMDGSYFFVVEIGWMSARRRRVALEN